MTGTLPLPRLLSEPAMSPRSDIELSITLGATVSTVLFLRRKSANKRSREEKRRAIRQP